MNTLRPETNLTPDNDSVKTPPSCKLLLKKTKDIMAAIALSAATLTGCATDEKTETPAQTTNASSSTAPLARKSTTGENIDEKQKLSFENWVKIYKEKEPTLKSYNTGNHVLLGAFGNENSIRNFRILTRREDKATRINGGNEPCDKICVDMNEKLAYYEDPYCKNPTTKYPLVHEALMLKQQGVTEISYRDLDDNDETAPYDSTKFIIANVENGKKCADLAKGKVNTGRGNVNVAYNGPTRKEFNTLSERVEGVEEKVEEHSETLADLVDAYRKKNTLCTDPQNPSCQAQFRSSTRKSVADEAKARAEKK